MHNQGRVSYSVLPYAGQVPPHSCEGDLDLFRLLTWPLCTLVEDAVLLFGLPPPGSSAAAAAHTPEQHQQQHSSAAAAPGQHQQQQPHTPSVRRGQS